MSRQHLRGRMNHLRPAPEPQGSVLRPAWAGIIGWAAMLTGTALVVAGIAMALALVTLGLGLIFGRAAR